MTLSKWRPDKAEKALALIQTLHTHTKTTLKDLESVIGFLNFACKVVVPGRAFLRRLINLTIGVTNPRHHIRLTKAAKADLAAWAKEQHAQKKLARRRITPHPAVELGLEPTPPSSAGHQSPPPDDDFGELSPPPSIPMRGPAPWGPAVAAECEGRAVREVAFFMACAGACGTLGADLQPQGHSAVCARQYRPIERCPCTFADQQAPAMQRATWGE